MNLKKRMKTLAGLCLLSGGLFAQNVCVSTPNTSLLLSAPEGGELRILYYGQKLTDTDLKTFEGERGIDAAYPVYGLTCATETALSVQHADGNMTLQMGVENVSTNTTDKATETVIRLKDKVYPFYVNVCYRAYNDVDIRTIFVW